MGRGGGAGRCDARAPLSVLFLFGGGGARLHVLRVCNCVCLELSGVEWEVLCRTSALCGEECDLIREPKLARLRRRACSSHVMAPENKDGL